MTFFGFSAIAQDSDSLSNEQDGVQETSSSEFVPAQQKREDAKKNQGIEIGKLRVSGFARALLFYRNMDEYEGYVPNSIIRGLNFPTTLGVGDGASQPLLMLRFEADVSSNTHFMIEQGFTNYLLTDGNNTATDPTIRKGADNPGRMAYIFNEFRFTADAVTNVGRITLTAGGGLTWRKISPFTMWSFIYRDDMFERLPWSPGGHNWRRYNVYYSTGDIPRDQRWGRRGVQGFVVDWKDMPGNFNATFMFGKSTVSGNYNQFLTRLPQNMVAGRVFRSFGSYEVGVNAYNQFGYNAPLKDVNTVTFLNGDQVNYVENRNGQSSYSADVRINYSSVRLYGEFGLGSYFSGTYHQDIGDDRSNVREKGDLTYYKRPWSEMLYAEADFKKDFIGWPFKVAAYRVGRHAVNNTSALLNSSIAEAGSGIDFQDATLGNAQFNTFYFQNMLTEATQLTNNRTGGSITTQKKFGKFVADLALGMQVENENIYALDQEAIGPGGYQEGATSNAGLRDGIAFYHIVNQYQRQRFNGVTNNNGPYGRIIADFRRSWTNLQITDTVHDYKKSYSMLDLGVKHKSLLFKKELILSLFGRANSIQDKFSPVPVFSDKAFLRQWFVELMGFYHLNNKWTLVGFVSREWAKGNNRTELADEDGERITEFETIGSITYEYAVFDENGKPIDQRGLGYGLGFDYDFSESGSVSVRGRRYLHEDKNFTKDKFDGYDVTCELKIYF